MKKLVYAILIIITIVLLCGCNNPAIKEESNLMKGDTSEQNISYPDIADDISDKNISEPEIVDEESPKIDRTEYLTGEIITDGSYIIYEHRGYSTLAFIPDKESLEIIADKYAERENYSLAYDSLKKVKDLPDKPGIYKVRVKIDRMDDYFYLFIDSIELTDEIGTVMYEGKEFETNDLDDTVNVKDRVCGLIVDYVNKTDLGGIIIRFAGEIECEGYYRIDPFENEVFGPTGKIYIDKEYEKDFPTIYGEKNIFSVWFSETNDLFDELTNHSLFGRGRFKTSGYYLVYNHGMGAGPGEVITEIISLEDSYKNMFKVEENQYLEYDCKDDEFVIVAVTKNKENYEHISTGYYYINKKSPVKIHLLSSDRYDYIVKSKANENEFILSTDGFNMTTRNTEVSHDLICKITENGATVGVKVSEADEVYKNLFALNDGEVVRLIDNRNDFVIVSVDKTDENSVIKYSDYYYINKNSLNKIFLFSSDEYDYNMGVVVNENQFVLLSKRPIKNNILEVHHSFICNITETDAIVEKAEDLNINRNMMDTSGKNFIIQGCITDIKVRDKAVILTLNDIKMREKDLLIIGDIIRDGLAEIQLYDNNKGGPDISIGDNITATCRQTVDNKIIYASGSEIKITE